MVVKKVLLIDDNSKNQREVYDAAFVDEEEYSDCLSHVEQVNSQSDLSFLDEVSCVMIHDSLEDYVDGEFKSDSHKAKDRIEDVIQSKNLPFVLFSDGHGMTADWREDMPNVVFSIKKSEFYRRLKSFLDNYRETGELDMRMIAYGKDFLKDLMSMWCQAFITKLADTPDDEAIDTSKIDKRSLRLIIKNAQPKIGTSFDDVMCDIEDGNITAACLRNNINNILSSVKKYGKNISSWK